MRIRDKEIFVLFVIGFTFVFILLCAGYIALSNWLWQYMNQTNTYQYTENYYIHSKNSYMANYADLDFLEEQGYIVLDVEDMEIQEECLELCKTDVEEMVKILSNQNHTTYITDVCLQVGDSIGTQGLDIVFSYKDDWYRDLTEGQYPITDNSISAVIGESLMSATTRINGKNCIWIGDMYVEVSGVFKNYNASEEDDSLVVFGGEKLLETSDAFHERLAEYMNNDEIVIIMGNSREPIAKEAFEGEIKRGSSMYLGEPGLTLQHSMEKLENRWSRNIWDYLYNIKSMMICVMVLFGIVNCVMLSKVWAARRQKDFLIMRIYGLSNKRILSLVLQELSMMAGIGLILAAVISVIYINVTDAWKTSEHMLEWLILILLLGFMLTVSVCILSVFLFVNKLKPAQAVRS